MFIEEATDLLLLDIASLFPFERGFSHMIIRFYQVLGERSADRVPTFMSQYRVTIPIMNEVV